MLAWCVACSWPSLLPCQASVAAIGAVSKPIGRDRRPFKYWKGGRKDVVMDGGHGSWSFGGGGGGGGGSLRCGGGHLQGGRS